MEIRELGLLDLELVMPLEQELFGQEAWAEKTMASELSNPNTLYVGLFDSELIGYAGLSTIPASFSSDVQTLGVRPGSQGRGLGKKLMQLLFERALALGSEQLLLEVRADNESALALYRSMGSSRLTCAGVTTNPQGWTPW
jgi:Acetyltransferases